MKLLTKLLPVILSVTFLTSCSDDDNSQAIGNDNAGGDETPTAPLTINAFVNTMDNYSALAAALKKTGLDTVLDDTDTQYTVFAPDNTALTTFLNENGFTNGLTDVNTDEEIALVKNILLNHVIGSELKASAVTSTAPGYVKNAAVGPKDLADEATNLSTYYAVVDGNVKINGNITATTPDAYDATNGIIHAIDKVIPLPTVVTFVLADPNFSSLKTSLTSSTPNTDFPAILSRSTGTTNTDNLDAPFTVFAPNDAAFAKVTDPLTETQLTDILLHHVIKGSNIVSGDLSDGITAAPISGGTLTINLPGNDNNPAKITDGKGNTDIDIIAVDIQAINGVIHAVETVLIPEAKMALATETK